MTIDVATLEGIHQSSRQFDIAAELSEEELRVFGLLTVLPPQPAAKEFPVLKDLDEAEDDSDVDAVASFLDSNSYNQQYMHYLKCQAIASLVAFDEGWKSFEELILKAYLIARRRENKEYRGSDPNQAFSLRVREQTAEDFIKFIRAVVNEAINTPKPILGSKK